MVGGQHTLKTHPKEAEPCMFASPGRYDISVLGETSN
jgi:hypothetical protein